MFLSNIDCLKSVLSLQKFQALTEVTWKNDIISETALFKGKVLISKQTTTE